MFLLRLSVLAGCAVHLVITLAVDTGTVATAGRCCNSLATVQLAGSAVLLWVESVLLIKVPRLWLHRTACSSKLTPVLLRVSRGCDAMPLYMLCALCFAVLHMYQLAMLKMHLCCMSVARRWCWYPCGTRQLEAVRV